MELKELHDNCSVSTKSISTKISTPVISIQSLKNELLKEHLTQTTAVLVCVQGFVEYEDENAQVKPLRPGDFIEITPMVKHWVKALENSQLLLIK